MKDEILLKSYEEILEDGKLIKLATLTYLFHSLIFVIYILYQTYFIFHQLSGKGNLSELIINYIQKLISHDNFIIVSIIIIIILAIGYFLLPPIAEASIIYYLNDKEKKISKSLGKGVLKFFPMFEFHGIISLFSFLAFFIALSRFYVLGIWDQFLVASILTLWFLTIIILSILTPYVKYIITLENLGVKEAIKKSAKLAIENLSITLKYVLINYFLYIRFIINILLIIGIPLLIILGIIKLNLTNSEIGKYIFIISIIFLTLLTAYINGIIEAYFLSYWNKVYQKIKNS